MPRDTFDKTAKWLLWHIVNVFTSSNLLKPMIRKYVPGILYIFSVQRLAISMPSCHVPKNTTKKFGSNGNELCDFEKCITPSKTGRYLIVQMTYWKSSYHFFCYSNGQIWVTTSRRQTWIELLIGARIFVGYLKETDPDHILISWYIQKCMFMPMKCSWKICIYIFCFLRHFPADKTPFWFCWDKCVSKDWTFAKPFKIPRPLPTESALIFIVGQYQRL